MLLCHPLYARLWSCFVQWYGNLHTNSRTLHICILYFVQYLSLLNGLRIVTRTLETLSLLFLKIVVFIGDIRHCIKSLTIICIISRVHGAATMTYHSARQ